MMRYTNLTPSTNHHDLQFISASNLVGIMRFFLVVATIFFSASICSASGNLYVAQTATGAASGASCSGAFSVSWFNNSGNWGGGASQIGPDTTVHLCGTFTAPANASSFLQFQGSGTSGHPITLKWETGAVVQAPYFGQTNGGIDTNGNSWLVLDGGTNGIVQNTANGTGLANSVSTTMLYLSGDNNTVKNLSFLNAYNRTNIGDSADVATWEIQIRNASNVTIGPNNTFTNSDLGVYFVWDVGQHDLVITGNTFSRVNQDIEMGPANSGALTMTNVRVDHNTASAWANWDDPAGNKYHHNFFHSFTNGPGSHLAGTLRIYDNSLRGDMGVYSTSLIYIETNNGSSGELVDPVYIFNNLLENTGGFSALDSSGILTLYSANGFLYNNVIKESSGNYTSAIFSRSANGWKVNNNIFVGGPTFIFVDDGISLNPASDRNVYFNGAGGGNNWFAHAVSTYSLVSDWQARCGCDSHSITSDPKQNSDLTLQATSPAAGLGTNFSSLGVLPLDSDYAGAARPSSAAWSAGAYQFGSSLAQQPSPPTGLSATVN